MTDQHDPATSHDPTELTDDELDSVAGGVGGLGGLMGDAVKPTLPTKTDVGVQTDTFPRNPFTPVIRKGG